MGPGGTRQGISGLSQCSNESLGVFGETDEQESLNSP